MDNSVRGGGGEVPDVERTDRENQRNNGQPDHWMRTTTIVGEKYSAHIHGYVATPAEAGSALRSLLDGEVLSRQDLVPLTTFGGQYALVISRNDGTQSYLLTDSVGSTPIYYAELSTGWSWSFRLKDIASSLTSRTIDSRGLCELFHYRWLMSEHTLFSEVLQTVPGEYVTLQQAVRPQKTTYKKFEFSPSAGPFSEEGLMDATRSAINDYFSKLRQQRSKIAIFFSGGVDSSLLLALAREHSFDELIAVTARYPSHENPELVRAERIAAHLGVRHEVVDVLDQYVGTEYANVVGILERPPTYFSSVARKRIYEHLAGRVDFILSGEGADCAFGNDELAGIARYDRKQRALSMLPRGVKRIAARGLRLFGSSIAARVAKLMTHGTLDFLRGSGSYEYGGKPRDLTMFDLVPALRKNRKRLERPFYLSFEPATNKSLFAIAQNRTLYTSNRNQAFVYNALGTPFGIDVGFPFMSTEVLNVAEQLPDLAKLDARGPKPILKKLACRYIPEEWVYESKYGFFTPGSDWLVGALEPLHRMLLDSKTASRKLFDASVLSKLSPAAGKSLLVTAITLEVFLREFFD